MNDSISGRRLNAKVAARNSGRTSDRLNGGYDHLEGRQDRLEDRMQKLELDIVREMAQMASAWQALAKAVDQLSTRIVTRPELDVVRAVSYCTAISFIGWIAWEVMRGAA